VPPAGDAQADQAQTSADARGVLAYEVLLAQADLADLPVRARVPYRGDPTPVSSQPIAPVFLAIPLLSMTGQAGQNSTALLAAGVLFAIIAGVTILRVRGVR